MDRAIFRVILLKIIPRWPETLDEKFLQKKEAAFRIKPNEIPQECSFNEN